MRVLRNRKHKGDSKKDKKKKAKKKSNNDDTLQAEENKFKQEINVESQNVTDNCSGNADDQNNKEVDTNNKAGINSKAATESEAANTSSDSNIGNNDTNNNIADTNDYCKEIKAAQQELLDKVKNLSEALTAITLIRDNVNSIRVDTLTELYFTRQVRPLLDALNILSFSVINMTGAAQNIQINGYGDRKEIKHALNLSYKMNDEVDDVIKALGRRLTIFLKQIDCMDKNCPPFDFGKDS
jgi:hypothetical protein